MLWPSADWDAAGPLWKVGKTGLAYPLKWLGHMHARGMEHCPVEGPLLVAPNHWGYFDPLAVAAVLPRPIVHFAKIELFRHPFLRWFFEDLGKQIPVDRQTGGNEVAMRRGLRTIEAGRCVAVYAEGTISRAPDLLPFRSGLARLALGSGAPVLPIGLTTDRFWPKPRLVPTIGEPVYVNVGPLLHFGRRPDLAEDPDVTADVSATIRGVVRRLVDEAWEARARGEAWAWKPRTVGFRRRP